MFPLVGLVRVMDIVVNEEPKITIHHFLKFFFPFFLSFFFFLFDDCGKRDGNIIYISQAEEQIRDEDKAARRQNRKISRWQVVN